jgi:hypothetical protein
MSLYRVSIDLVTDGRLKRIAAEAGCSVEELIENAAAEAALEFAKRQGWPLDASAIGDT